MRFWENGIREGIVEITEVNERFIGNPVSNGFKDTDVEILNLTYDENIWKGMIYSLEKDRYFYVECEMEDDQMLLLNISVSFVTKELRWVRIPGSVCKEINCCVQHIKSSLNF